MNRILWNYRPDDRERGGDIDEIVVHHPRMVHVEQVNDECWWIAVYMGDDGDPYWMGNFTLDDAGMLTFTVQEDAGMPWDRDDSHEEATGPETLERCDCGRAEPCRHCEDR